MSDQTKIQTVGPEDSAATTRAKLYAGLSALLGLLSFAVTLGFVTTDQGASIAQIVQGVMGLLGAGGLAFASAKTNKQVKNGTFDDAPPDPVGNVFEQLGILKGQVDRTVSDSIDQITNAAAVIQGAVATIPGGSLINAAVMSGPVGDLIQAMTDRTDDR